MAAKSVLAPALLRAMARLTATDSLSLAVRSIDTISRQKIHDQAQRSAQPALAVLQIVILKDPLSHPPEHLTPLVLNYHRETETLDQSRPAQQVGTKAGETAGIKMATRTEIEKGKSLESRT